MKFPIWAMRAYDEIHTEGTIKLIYTYKNRYILDDTSIPGDYLDRRLEITRRILAGECEHKLYPLKYKFDNPVQIYHHKDKSKTFIDSEGRISKYIPKTFIEVECKKCKCYETQQNIVVAVVADEPYHFNIKEPAAYLSLVTWLGTRMVLETHDSKPEKLTYRRKI